MPPGADTSRRWREWLPAAVLAGGVVAAALRGGSWGPVERGELFVIVLWVLALAISLGLVPRHRAPRSGALAVAALVALAGWMAVGLIWTESAERTVTEVARTLGLAGVLLLVLWTFGGGGWQIAAGAMTAATVVVSAVALGSRLAPDLLPSPLATAGLYRRLGYPLNYWNGLGAWAAMTVALSLAWSAHARQAWVRGAALGGVCLAIPVAYLTYSRAAAIAVALAVVGVVAVSRHRWQAVFNAALAAAGATAIIVTIRDHPEIAEGRGAAGGGAVAAVCAAVVAACLLAGLAGLTEQLSALRLPRRATTATLAVAAVVVLVGAGAVGPALADRVWESFQRREESSAVIDPAQRLYNLSGVRQQLWAVGLDAFGHHPLHGTGAGTYEFVWNRDPRRDSAVRDAHSLYVESLAELGLPGALLVAAGLAAVLTAALRAPFRQPDAAAAGAAGGCAVALLVFCVAAGVDWMWELTAVAVLGLACGGLAMVAGAPRAPRLRRVPRSAAALAVFAGLAIQLPVLVAASEVRTSRKAIREGRVEQALAAADTAIAAQPWGAGGHLQRALVLERAGQLGSAAVAARHATEREATNWQTWLILGRIEAERGRTSAALRAARHARRLNPRSPLFGPS